MQNFNKFFRVLFFLVFTSQLSLGQSISTTTPLTNNGNFHSFDVETGSEAITINSFDVRLNSLNSETVTIYYKAGTHVGSQTNAGAWTLLGSTTVTGLGGSNRTPVPIGG